jgi:very-short-patch-repair endonuclease
MSKQQINNLPYLKDNRKALRNNLTSAEATLWKFLKGSQLEGRKFRRQHSIENYILDFYCPSERINIELDGEHHFTEEGAEKDKVRDEFLTNLGIKVLRIENRDIFENFDNVMEMIKDNFKKK